MYIGGGDMFPHTSKRPFSGFSAEIGRISSKEKVLRPFQIGQNTQFLVFFSRFYDLATPPSQHA